MNTITLMSFPNVSSNSTIIPNGPWTWARQFQSHGTLIAIAIAVAVFFRSHISGILATWPFFTRRYDFIRSNFEKTGSNVFSFKVLYVRIVQDYSTLTLSYTFLFVAFSHGG